MKSRTFPRSSTRLRMLAEADRQVRVSFRDGIRDRLKMRTIFLLAGGAGHFVSHRDGSGPSDHRFCWFVSPDGRVGLSGAPWNPRSRRPGVSFPGVTLAARWEAHGNRRKSQPRRREAVMCRCWGACGWSRPLAVTEATLCDAYEDASTGEPTLPSSRPTSCGSNLLVPDCRLTFLS